MTPQQFSVPGGSGGGEAKVGRLFVPVANLVSTYSVTLGRGGTGGTGVRAGAGMTPPEARWVLCGCPACDHTPLRYPLKAWWKHLLLRVVSRPLNKIQDTSEGI